MKGFFNKLSKKEKKSKNETKTLNITYPENHPLNESKQEDEERIPVQAQPLFNAAVMGEINQRFGVEKKQEAEEANHGPYGDYLLEALERTTNEIKPLDQEGENLVKGSVVQAQLRVLLSDVSDAQRRLDTPSKVTMNGKAVPDGHVCITSEGRKTFGTKIFASIKAHSYYPETTLDSFATHFTIIRAEHMHTLEHDEKPIFKMENIESTIDIDESGVKPELSSSYASVTGKSKKKADGSKSDKECEDAHIVQEVREDLADSFSGPELINKTFSQAARAVAAEKSGTTACAAYINPETHSITVGNCGDSRAMLVKGGEIIPLTYDHDVADSYEAGKVVSRGGYILQTKVNSKDAEFAEESGTQVKARVNDLVQVTRSLGENNTKLAGIIPPACDVLSQTPEITSVEYADDSYLIITCDGVFEKIASNSLTDPDNFHTIISSKNPAEQIIQLASASGSLDDISVIVVDLNALKKPLMAGVFDGHNGKQAAIGAKEAVEATLSMSVEGIKNINAKDEIADIKAKAAERNKGQAL